MTRSLNPVPQYLDNSGAPYAGGKMYFFSSATNIPKTTYADINQTIPNPHPIILDAAGRLPNVFFDGSARQVLATANDVQVWERDPVTTVTSTSTIPSYNPQEIYGLNDVVTASDNNYYRSLQNNNQNNNPLTATSFWNRVEFLEFWNTNITYGLGDNAKTTDGRVWRSLQNSNTGNDPSTSPTFWKTFDNDIAEWNTAVTYSLNQPVLRDGLVFRSSANDNQGSDPLTEADKWQATVPDALGRIDSTTTFAGYGIASTNNSGSGIQNVVFERSATGTQEQIITISMGGTSALSYGVEKTGVNSCTVRTWLSSGTTTPINEFPIDIKRWLL